MGVMAVGKNKGLSKGGKKGAKKKIVDPFTRKDWYDIKAPSIFKVRDVGKTLVNRTQGTRIASDGLKGRYMRYHWLIYNPKLMLKEVSVNSGSSAKMFKANCLTNFYGMTLTTD